MRYSLIKSSFMAALLLTLCASPLPAGTTPTTRAGRPELQLVVSAAAQGLGGILARISDRQEQHAIIKQYVHAVRLFPDKSGYFFVLQTDGYCVAHGIQPNLEESNLMDHRDIKGFPIVRAMLKASRNGGDFIEYHWEKPGSEGFFQKLGYVEPIPGTDYILGSGVYFPEPW